MPECPDVADAWRKIAEAYLPDGIREFSGMRIGQNMGRIPISMRC